MYCHGCFYYSVVLLLMCTGQLSFLLLVIRTCLIGNKYNTKQSIGININLIPTCKFVFEVC